MTAKEYIRKSLDMSTKLFMDLVKDMRDAPLTFPTPKGGNHPLWILGHCVFAERAFMHGLVKGEKNPLEDWGARFGTGSEPEADASKYPSFDDLLGEFDQARAHTLNLLESLSDEDLGKPTHAPPEFRSFFPTIADCFIILTHHYMTHAGQVACSRRVLGRKPVLM